MNRFRTRLTLIFIAMIGLAMIVAGFFMAELLKSSHLDALRQSLLREARLLRTTVDWKWDGDEASLMRYYSGLADTLRKSADARVTFIRADGKVLGDSDHDAAGMDNHYRRREVAESREKGVGYSIRFSDTIRQNMMYVALPVRQGERIEGYLRLSISLALIEASIRKLWYFLIAGLAAVFLVAGLVIYRISSAMTRPIENITKVAREMTGMNYEARVPVRHSDDEIGQLGKAIHAMADSLRLQVNRIRENESRLQTVLDNMISGVVMVECERRVTLVNRAAEEIVGLNAREMLGKSCREARLPEDLIGLVDQSLVSKSHMRGELVFHYPEERTVEVNAAPLQADPEWSGVLVVLHDITALRRLENMRSEFVANVSHELKTPVAAVKGFAETLLSGALEDRETAKTFLQIIYDESERLDRLIGDILELSRIESRRAALNYSPVELGGFLTDLVHILEPAARKKQIRLEVQVGEDLYIEADEDRLRQILINLLQNGINYTPEGGKVSVFAEPAEAGEDYEHIRLTVADTGIGIPRKDLPRIFERFYRVDKARSRSSGGTGLGLSIVKHLVELHRGTIRVESEVGIGTRFILELPVVQP